MVAIKRKRVTKNRFRKKAKMAVPRGPRLRGAVCNIKRTTYSTAFQVSTASTSGFWNYYSPTLNNGFNNFAELAAVFDTYRVNAIKLTFRPRFDSLAAPTTGATPMTVAHPYITYCIDPHNKVSPTGLYNSTTLNVLLENGNTRTVRSTRPVSMYWRPLIEIPTNVGSGSTFRRPGWLPTTAADVPFRGCHVFHHTNGFSTALTDVIYDLSITWYITLKNLK